jgi:hypothetical protein
MLQQTTTDGIKSGESPVGLSPLFYQRAGRLFVVADALQGSADRIALAARLTIIAVLLIVLALKAAIFASALTTKLG